MVRQSFKYTTFASLLSLTYGKGKGKGKGKADPRIRQEGPERGKEVQLHYFFNLGAKMKADG